MKNPARTTFVTFRCPVDLLERLDSEATTESRTRTGQLIHMLRRSLPVAEKGRIR